MNELQIDTPVGRFAGIDFGGAGPDVLLLHQFTSNAQTWAPLAPHLRGFCRPVAIDIRGHGRSEATLEGEYDVMEDLRQITVALGMRRPLILVEGDDLLILSGGDFSAIDPVGVVTLGLICTMRGDDAVAWFTEQYGADEVQIWADRFGLFASGTSAERPDFVARTVDRACADWLVSGISQPHWQAYLERALRDTADGGWERVPRRDEYVAFVKSILSRPMGLDLYDQCTAPLTFVMTRQQMGASELLALDGYVRDRSDRALEVIDGGAMLSVMEPLGLRRVVRQLLLSHGDGPLAARGSARAASEPIRAPDASSGRVG